MIDIPEAESQVGAIPHAQLWVNLAAIVPAVESDGVDEQAVGELT